MTIITITFVAIGKIEVKSLWHFGKIGKKSLFADDSFTNSQLGTKNITVGGHINLVKKLDTKKLAKL